MSSRPRAELGVAVLAAGLLGGACLRFDSFSAAGFGCSADSDCDPTTFCLANTCQGRVDAGGKPGFSNTGIPQLPGGVSLSVVGGLTLTEDGGVVDLEDIQGCVQVQASGVTLRRSRITCGGYWMVDVAPGVTGLTLEDVELVGQGFDQTTAVNGAGVTLRRANLHGMGNAVFAQDDWVVENSWIHDLIGQTPSGFSTNGSAHLRVTASTFDLSGQHGSAISVGSSVGPLSDVQVQGNWLYGGDTTVLAGGDSASDVQVNKNRFGKNALVAPLQLRGGATASENVFDDDNSPVNP